MAYKNIISAWQDIELSAQEIASVRAIVTGAFKRAGGKGALPSVVSCKNILKGKVAVDAEAFEAGNVQEAPAQIMAKPLSKLAKPASEGGADSGLAEKLATIEKALAMLLTQGLTPSHAPSAKRKGKMPQATLENDTMAA
jgi:hypothetical protein